ncbi:MAG: D-alanine--D-alanine ligase [Saprospirales bacterium]|nr:MAG: D-alanine--D-alanine ligase [Saprospirales bacterium]
MKKKTIAIVTGGFSEERIISLKSAKFVEDNLDKEKYKSRRIIIDLDKWYEEDSGVQIDKNDFSLQIGADKITFDFAFLIIHGPPVENGLIQGYFDLLGIPYSTCDTFTSALCFNKQATKNYLKPFGIPMVDSILFTNNEQPTQEDIKRLGFPIFVKPNNHGSSFGISKVKNLGELKVACEKAYAFDNEILIEQYMEGREFSCGVVKKSGKTTALPVTEIISETEFFDFAAKYEHKSQEITPAKITKEQSDICRKSAARIYDLLSCRGMARVDFILHNGIFKILEVNTVPGLSPESIIPAQVKAMGWSYEEFLEELVEGVKMKE